MARAKRSSKQKSIPEVKSSPELKISKFSSLFSIRNIILIGLLILIVLAWKFRGYFIAASVNGQPISRWELTDKLIRRFGKQTLDDIINERLLLAALRQKGIFITADEIGSRVKQVEERLKGSLSLSDALASQGLTSEEFKRQIEIQLSIERLFDKEATVSSAEVEDYIRKNSQAYKNATDPAALKQEVSAILRQQKISDLFDTWFNQIKKNAKVQNFFSF